MKTVFLVFLLVFIFKGEQITLNRFQQAHIQGVVHTTLITVGKQTFKLAFNLSDDHSWIKSNNCVLCKGDSCKQQCSDKIGTTKYGLICEKGICKDLGVKYQQNNMLGRQMQLHMKIGNKVFNDTKIISTNKIQFQPTKLNKQYDGVLSLFQSSPFVSVFSLIFEQKKLRIILNQSVPSKYYDQKDNQTIQFLEQKYSLNVSGLSLDNQNIYFNNYQAFVSINTKFIILPSSQYEQFKNKVTVIQNGCKIQNTKIMCQNNTQLTKIKDSLFGIQLKNSRLQIPFSSLLEACENKQCDVMIKQQEGNKIVLGQIFLQNYGVFFQLNEKKIIFYRLRNGFSNRYHTIIKHKGLLDHQNQEFPRTLSGFIYHFAKILLKIGIVIGIYYAILNIYMNRKQLQQKFKNYFYNKKLKYSPAHEWDGENGGMLVTNDYQETTKQFWQDNTIEGI